MTRFSASVLVAVTLILTTPDLFAQDHTLGMNLRVLGTTQVGLTWVKSPSLTIRPAVSASWAKTTLPFGSSEGTRLVFDLDFLFAAATRDRVTVYSGIGGSIGRVKASGETSTVWHGRALLGARVSLIDRVALYGEVGLEYADDGAFGAERVALGTYPLGIVVFLK